MIPKPDGEWHIIYHISAPHRSSINDFLDPEQYSLSYCSVDYAVAIVNTLGKDYYVIAKIDLKWILFYPSEVRGLGPARHMLQKQ